MIRRDFLKMLPLPILGLLGFKLAGCGEEHASTSNDLSLTARMQRLENLRIWSYYVPLTSYEGILEEVPGRHALDRKVVYEKLRRVTSRINGNESDGTANPATLNVDQLQQSAEYLRVHFWHDDNTPRETGESHSLFIFKRYLTELEAGQKVFVATGIFQNHFHIVMIEP